MQTLSSFLLYLGTTAGTGAVVAALLQYAPYLNGWFTNLPYEGKRLALMLICFAVPAAATGAQVALGYVTSTPDVWFGVLSAGGLAYVGSQAAHLGIRRQEMARGMVSR